MPCIEYVPHRFNTKARRTIERANAIIEAYQRAGFVLTLRQLFYQFVTREFISNSQKEYQALSVVINNARLAGQVDWDAIEDRTRTVRERPHWDDPAGVIGSAATSYGLDLWLDQRERVEVWIEKDALIGVIERVCNEWDVPYFSCRGYTSQSAVWRAAERHKGYGVPVVVIHLGDHDPSGVDMTRDVGARLKLFGAPSTVERIALSMQQIRRFKLPPNPAKATDRRFEEYRRKHSEKSWELDALDPATIVKLTETAILKHLDRDRFDARFERQEEDRKLLNHASSRWPDLVERLTQP